MINRISEIPSSFKVANQTITVKLVDKTNENEYGYYDDAANEIVLAKNIETDKNGKIELNTEQVLNSFWHELFHVFQFYYNTEFDEAQAQSYSNFMREFLSSIEI